MLAFWSCSAVIDSPLRKKQCSALLYLFFFLPPIKAVNALISLIVTLSFQFTFLPSRISLPEKIRTKSVLFLLVPPKNKLKVSHSLSRCFFLSSGVNPAGRLKDSFKSVPLGRFNDFKDRKSTRLN